MSTATLTGNGGTVLDKICKMGRFNEKKASQYIGAILAAFSYMHSLDIVHRDLKCQNLVFDRKGSEGRLQIIDFGESLMAQSGTEYTDFVGTIHYVPPEIYHSRTMEDLKAGDCWSIGVVAYLLIVGSPPFCGKSPKQIFSNISNKKKKLRFPRGVTASFKSFIRSLLSRDIKQRMTAAQALEHPWISGDGASTDYLCSSYLQSLRKFNRGNKLQNIMVSACIEKASNKDKKAMEQGLLDMTRSHSQIRDEDVVDYLLLHTKVTERAVSYKGNGQIQYGQNLNIPITPIVSSDDEKLNLDDFDLAERMMAAADDVVSLQSLQRAKSAPVSYRVEASEQDILTRKISEHRFAAIMESTPYDASALIEDLADADGMISLDVIAHYKMDMECGSYSESDSRRVK